MSLRAWVKSLELYSLRKGVGIRAWALARATTSTRQFLKPQWEPEMFDVGSVTCRHGLCRYIPGQYPLIFKCTYSTSIKSCTSCENMMSVIGHYYCVAVIVKWPSPIRASLYLALCANELKGQLLSHRAYMEHLISPPLHANYTGSGSNQSCSVCCTLGSLWPFRIF